MFFINTYQWEWTTALALFAPKPLLFANSDHDTIFPMDGNRRIIERLRKCYTLLGKPENVDEYVSKGGHDYRPDLRIAVFSFLNKHLKGDTGPVKDADFPKIDGKDLRVFPEDKDLPKDQINDRIDELFVPKAEVKLPKAGEFKEWKAGLVKKLRETSFRAMPEKVPPVERGRELSAGMHTASSEPGVEFLVVENMNEGGRVGASVFLLNPDDQVSAGTEFFKGALGSNDLFTYTLAPRGGLQFRWSRKNPPNTVERSLALLGQTADTGRVRDITSMFANIQIKEDKGRYRIIGRGPAGIIAAYAALCVPGVNMELVILDPPASHRDGPHFLNVDRVLDLPTALGLLAPDVKLTLINAKDPAFDKTAAIYKLAGAADKFERK
jgi:hypothetical protein